jgi:hypothetical protein
VIIDWYPDLYHLRRARRRLAAAQARLAAATNGEEALRARGQIAAWEPETDVELRLSMALFMTNHGRLPPRLGWRRNRRAWPSSGFYGHPSASALAIGSILAVPEHRGDIRRSP